MENSAQDVSSYGNGNISQMPKPMSPDVDQLTRDFRTFIADCETLFRNATTLCAQVLQLLPTRRGAPT